MERKKTLQYHEGDDNYKTFHGDFPNYLEGLDTQKIKDWRGQHPNRFHCTKRVQVEKHYDPRNTGTFSRSGPISKVAPATMNAIEQKKSLKEILE